MTSLGARMDQRTILIDTSRCDACGRCELACAVFRSSKSKRLCAALGETPSPASRLKVQTLPTGAMPVLCLNCRQAPCVDACPVGAMQRDADDLVFVDEARCVGCWMCVMVCPFGAITPSFEDDLAIKCDRCREMDAMACVTACPTGALASVPSAAGLSKSARTRVTAMLAKMPSGVEP